MSNWRDMAARVLAESAPPEIAPAVSPVSSEIANGLAILSGRRTPRGCADDVWREIVTDANRIAREGWAEQALALGWSLTDLFGIGPNDDWEFSGLAVWLASRKVLLIDGAKAIAGAGDSHAIFHRGGLGHGKQPTVTPVLIWHFRRD